MACRSIEQFSLARSTDDRSVANEAAQYIVVSSRCGANPSSGKNELVVIAYIYRCAAGVCTYRLLFSYISSFAAPSDCVASEQVQSPVSWLAWRAVDSRFARARPPRIPTAQPGRRLLSRRSHSRLHFAVAFQSSSTIVHVFRYHFASYHGLRTVRSTIFDV